MEMPQEAWRWPIIDRAPDLSPLSEWGGSQIVGRLGLFLTQAVWKRFSYPNNWKEPGAMDLEATC
jgi:hypothetical protein